MNKVLVVVDMQNDFVGGTLKVLDADKIISGIRTWIELKDWDELYFTKDVHDADEWSIEAERLPHHCLRETCGSEIVAELSPWATAENVLEKNSFGLKDFRIFENASVIEICGVCTDICVLTIALQLRAQFPNKKIVLLESLCKGSTQQMHECAVRLMENCLIKTRG